MPEEESSLLLIKNPPNRVTIQLEEESEGKKGRIWREKRQGKEWRNKWREHRERGEVKNGVERGVKGKEWKEGDKEQNKERGKGGEKMRRIGKMGKNIQSTD